MVDATEAEALATCQTAGHRLRWQLGRVRPCPVCLADARATATPPDRRRPRTDHEQWSTMDLGTANPAKDPPAPQTGPTDTRRREWRAALGLDE